MSKTPSSDFLNTGPLASPRDVAAAAWSSVSSSSDLSNVFVDLSEVNGDDRLVLYPDSHQGRHDGKSAYPESLRECLERGNVRVACAHMCVQSGKLSNGVDDTGVVSVLVLSRSDVLAHPDLSPSLLAAGDESHKVRFLQSAKKRLLGGSLVRRASQNPFVPELCDVPVQAVNLENQPETSLRRQAGLNPKHNTR